MLQDRKRKAIDLKLEAVGGWAELCTVTFLPTQFFKPNSIQRKGTKFQHLNRIKLTEKVTSGEQILTASRRKASLYTECCIRHANLPKNCLN